MSFELRCDPHSLELAASGALWGAVWVEVEDNFFPEKRWNDMAVAFIAELLEAFTQASVRKVSERTVRFFDGPYWLKIGNADVGHVSISVNESFSLPSVVVDVKDAIRSLTTTAESVLDVCVKSGWESQRDVRRLDSLIRPSMA